MATISDRDLNLLIEAVGNSYTDAKLFSKPTRRNSAADYIARAKTLVLGGHSSNNCIMASRLLDDGTVLDLYPAITGSDTTITFRAGQFYLDGVLHEMGTDRAVSYLAGGTGIITYSTWASASYSSDTQGEVKTAQRLPGLVYISNEPITGSPNMASGKEVSIAADVNCRLTDTIEQLAFPFVPAVNLYLDKVRVFMKSVYTTVAPNTPLIAKVYTDSASAPDTLVCTSEKIYTVSQDGEWVDFQFKTPSNLVASTAYWLVLDADTPELGSPSNLSASIYFQVYLGSAANNNNGSTDVNKKYASASWATIGSNATKLPAIQYINYIKTTLGLPVGSADTDDLLIPVPSNTIDYIPLVELYLYSPTVTVGAGATNVTTANISTGATDSLRVDVRPIAAYIGLEDEDQVNDLLSGFIYSQDMVEAYGTDGANSTTTLYGQALRGLYSHIVSRASSTFRNYCRTNELYYNSAFREAWYGAFNEEVGLRFGSFTTNASSTPVVFPDAPRWTADYAYTAYRTNGVTSLEAYLALDSAVPSADVELYAYAVRNIYAILASDVIVGGATLTVKDASELGASGYLFIQTDESPDATSELVKFTASGNVITLVAETNVVTGTLLSNHLAGSRIYLVERLPITIAATTAAGLATSITSTNNYVGIAFVNTVTASEAGVIVEIRPA